MGCKGSKHALHMHGAGCGMAALAPESPQQQRRRRSGLSRHSVAVALRSSTLGTLSLDRAAAAVAVAGLSFDAAAAAGAGGGDGGVVVDEGMMKPGNDDDVDGAATTAAKNLLMLGPSRSFGGWRPTTPPHVAPPPPTKRQKRVATVAAPAPRTPNKTPVREPPEEINVWELMKGLDDDDDDEETGGGCGCVCAVHAGGGGAERKARSAPGSPQVFDPELLDAFRTALDGLATADSPLPGLARRDGGGGIVAKREIETFPGIVRARVEVFEEKTSAKAKLAKKVSPPPPPESAGRVVVYLTSLRSVRQTHEDCWSTAAILRGYGVRVDERDLAMHAGFKDELRAALGGPPPPPLLPQVFADGRHLGGAEEVRRLHEAGALASALDACEAAPCAASTKGGGAAGGGAQDACARCGGVRFVLCDACSGSRRVFVEDDDGSGGGAFARCPECNENGLVKCAAC